MTIQEIKTKIESETGLKVSTKINSLNSSMRGYITFTTKKQKGEFTEWSFEYSQKLINEFEMPEPNPTFCSKYEFNLYFGNEIYN